MSSQMRAGLPREEGSFQGDKETGGSKALAEVPAGRAQEHRAISERETRSPGGGKDKGDPF